MLEPSLRRAEIAWAERKAASAGLTPMTFTCGRRRRCWTNKAGGSDAALRLLRAALELDPGLLAHGYAAWLHEQRYFRGGLDPGRSSCWRMPRWCWGSMPAIRRR